MSAYLSTAMHACTCTYEQRKIGRESNRERWATSSPFPIVLFCLVVLLLEAVGSSSSSVVSYGVGEGSNSEKKLHHAVLESDLVALGIEAEKPCVAVARVEGGKHLRASDGHLVADISNRRVGRNLPRDDSLVVFSIAPNDSLHQHKCHCVCGEKKKKKKAKERGAPQPREPHEREEEKDVYTAQRETRERERHRHLSFLLLLLRLSSVSTDTDIHASSAVLLEGQEQKEIEREGRGRDNPFDGEDGTAKERDGETAVFHTEEVLLFLLLFSSEEEETDPYSKLYRRTMSIDISLASTSSSKRKNARPPRHPPAPEKPTTRYRKAGSERENERD